VKEVYFIRHGLEWEKALGPQYKGLNQYLFDNRLIAIHFDNTDSWEESDYDKAAAKSAIRYMNNCDSHSDSKVIFASYSFSDGNRIVFGTPKKKSKFFLTSIGSWPAVQKIKVLGLEHDGRELHLDEFPFAFLLTPQQSTFVHWKQCEEVANAKFFGQGLDISNPAHYLPWAIEVLCEEYLRQANKLNRKLFRTGGTLKDLDIVGLDSNNRIVLSQVKNDDRPSSQKAFESSVSEMSKRQDVIGYYFYNGKKRASQVTNVAMITIKEVLDFFRDEVEYLGMLQLVNMRSLTLIST